MRKYLFQVAVALIICAGITFAGVHDVEAKEKKCECTGCSSKPISGGRYCSSHTCIAPGCKNRQYGGGTSYCCSHRCNMQGCSSKRTEDSNFCSTHKSAGKAAEAKIWRKVQNSSSNKSTYSTKNKSTGKSSTKKTSSSSKKKYDPYDVYSYKSAQDFADDKYEEFYDYEDDFDDEDEAYDAAEDYWRDHH